MSIDCIFNNTFLRSKNSGKSLDPLETSSVSNKILEHSLEKSEQIISNTQVSTRHIKEEFEKSLEVFSGRQRQQLAEVNASMLNMYKDEISTEMRNGISQLKDVTQTLQKEMVTEIASFKEELRSQTMGREDALEKKINEKYSQLETELQEYKDTKIKKIDQEVFKLAKVVSEKILGAAIDTEGQQKLILDALNDAKQEGIFN